MKQYFSRAINAGGEEFSFLTNLRRHKQNIHSGIKTEYNCNFCGKSYKTKDALKKHSNSRHDGKFSCNKKVIYPNKEILQDEILDEEQLNKEKCDGEIANTADGGKEKIVEEEIVEEHIIEDEMVEEFLIYDDIAFDGDDPMETQMFLEASSLNGKLKIS